MLFGEKSGVSSFLDRISLRAHLDYLTSDIRDNLLLKIKFLKVKYRCIANIPYMLCIFFLLWACTVLQSHSAIVQQNRGSSQEEEREREGPPDEEYGIISVSDRSNLPPAAFTRTQQLVCKY